MATSPTVVAPYTLEQAEEAIAKLTGQVTLLEEVIAMLTTGPVPNQRTDALQMYNMSGQLKYLSTDTQAYNCGLATLVTTGTQTISATTPGVSFMGPLTVAPGTYQIKAVFNYLENQAAGTPSFYFFGPARSGGRVNLLSMSATGGATSPLSAYKTDMGSANAMPGLVMNAVMRTVYIDAQIAFTNGGLVYTYGFTSVGADTFTIQAGSYMSTSPQT